MGTPEFMAPEQMAGDDIGPYTDLYAVGVLLFELFSGRQPFPAETLAELIKKKTDKDYDPFSRLEGVVLSEGLMGVIRRAIQRDPAARFQRAKALDNALMAALDDLGGVWTPPALWEVARMTGAPELEDVEAADPAEPSPDDGAVAPQATQDAFERWLSEEGDRLEREQARLATERARRKQDPEQS
jgi:serine/threonine-protein kinase